MAFFGIIHNYDEWIRFQFIFEKMFSGVNCTIFTDKFCSLRFNWHFPSAFVLTEMFEEKRQHGKMNWNHKKAFFAQAPIIAADYKFVWQSQFVLLTFFSISFNEVTFQMKKPKHFLHIKHRTSQNCRS